MLQTDISKYNNHTDEGSLKAYVLRSLGMSTTEHKVEYVIEAYVSALGEVLNLRPWQFATRIEPLVAYSDDVGGYYIPQDKVKILAIGELSCDCEFHPQRYQQLVKVDKQGYHTNRLFPCGCGRHIKYTCYNNVLSTWTPIARRLLKVIMIRNLHMKTHNDIHLNVLQKTFGIISAALQEAADNDDVQPQRMKKYTANNYCSTMFRGHGVSVW